MTTTTTTTCAYCSRPLTRRPFAGGYVLIHADNGRRFCADGTRHVATAKHG